MSFAKALCETISNDINDYSGPDKNPEPRPESTDLAPSKDVFADIRERRKLGKRILKAVQPQLEVALRVESEISNKPFEILRKELEDMMDESIEAGRPGTATSQGKQTDEANDTIMVDAMDASEITVKGDYEEDEAMDTAEDGDEAGNIEVNTSCLESNEADEPKENLPNGMKTSDTPPDTDGYVTMPGPIQSGPPTPPHSNGSLSQEATDPLNNGGILWYLKACRPQGTSVLSDHWAAGRDAVRMLSEDLTDLDDEELKGLGVGVDVDNGVLAAVAEADEVADEVTVAKAKVTRAKKRRVSGRRR